MLNAMQVREEKILERQLDSLHRDMCHWVELEGYYLRKGMPEKAKECSDFLAKANREIPILRDAWWKLAQQPRVGCDCAGCKA